jgi:hypothetical protein
MQPAKVFGFENVFCAGLAENDRCAGQFWVTGILCQDMGTSRSDDELVALGLGLQQIEFWLR